MEEENVADLKQIEITSLLRPYKSIGIFLSTSNPVCYSAGKKEFLAVSTGNSFKIFKLPELKIKLLGPHFPNSIASVAAVNEFLYLATKNEIIQMKYYHIVNRFIGHKEKVLQILIVGNALISYDRSNTVFIWDSNKACQLNTFQTDFDIIQMIHPITYLNKVLLIGRRNLQIWNINTVKLVYSFDESVGAILKDSVDIVYVESSPLLDVIALALSNGMIWFHNIKTDKALFNFCQGTPPVSLAFSRVDRALMASGDNQGSVHIWDLNAKKSIATIKNAHRGAVNFVKFLNDELIMLTGSADENAIFEWKYEEMQEEKFVKIRMRKGLEGSIKKLRFYDEGGLHILAASNNSDGELRDFSLLNENMSITFSNKKNKNMAKNSFATENKYYLNEISDFSFSVNREKDWGNIVTLHKSSEKPCLWSGENHSIIKLKLEPYENEEQRKMFEAKSNFPSACFVSKCGNFAVLGYKNGLISKVNMQSGYYQKSFYRPEEAHNSMITVLLIDSYNKYLVSGDKEGALVFWDFFSAAMIEIKKFSEEENSTKKKPTLLRQGNHSHLLLIGFSNNSLEIWDLHRRICARKFIGHSKILTDACFSFDNRHVFSASLDCTIKIWDIISGNLIGNINLDNYVTSIDVSPDGELIASAFANRREINLWHSMLGVSPWGNETPKYVKFASKINDTSNQGRMRFYLDRFMKAETEDLENLNKELEAEEIAFFEKNLEENQKGLIKFTEVPIGKWLPLVHLDLIKEKNKPKERVETNPDIPFFLNFAEKDKIKDELKEKQKKEKGAKNKILKSQVNQLLDELGTRLESFLYSFSETQPLEILEYFKGLTPSQIDYELRKACFGNMENIEKMLEFFEKVFELDDDFDLKQVYFNTFLKINFDELTNLVHLRQKVGSINKIIEDKWRKLDDKFSQVFCLLEVFAKVKS